MAKGRSPMKTIVISDLHFSDRTDQIHKTIFSDLMKDLSDQKPDYLIFLGDFLDSPNCSPDLFRFLIGSLEPLRDNSIPLMLVLGDHEMSNPGRATPLTYFSNVDGIEVIEKVHGVKLQGQHCMFLPPDVKNLNYLKDQELDAIFFHGFIQNAKVSKNYRMYRDSDFSVKDFLDFGAKNYFFAGIHIRQFFDVSESEKTDFCGYSGALWQHNFGEENNPTGYSVWDTEGGVTLIDIVAPRFKTVRFPGKLFEITDQLEKLQLPEGQWNLRLILDEHLPGSSLDLLRKIATEKDLLSIRFEAVSKEHKVSDKKGLFTTPVSEQNSLQILEKWLEIQGLQDAKMKIVMKRATDLYKTMPKR